MKRYYYCKSLECLVCYIDIIPNEEDFIEITEEQYLYYFDMVQEGYKPRFKFYGDQFYMDYVKVN